MGTDRTLLLAGLGGVGYETLRLLCGDSAVDRIVAADVRSELGEIRANTAEYQALHLGRYPRVEFVGLDLLDVNAIAEAVGRFDPDVVFTAATLLRYAPFEEFPEEIRERLIGFSPQGPGYAPIVPGQIPLVYNVMRGVEAADGADPSVVNVSLPDVVNPALAGAGHPPLLGTGNVGHLVPPIKRVAGDRFDVPANQVDAYVVAAHSTIHPILFYSETEGLPFYAKILVDGTDVTDEIDIGSELRARELPFPGEPSAREISILTGTLSARIVRAIVTDSRELIHAPAPEGRPGGYPVRVGRDGTEIVLPDDVSLEEAERINDRGLRYDGIDAITDDGTVVLTETARDAMDDLLGIDLKSFTPDESLAVTEEIIHGYRSLAEAHGIEPKLSVHW